MKKKTETTKKAQPRSPNMACDVNRKKSTVASDQSGAEYIRLLNDYLKLNHINLNRSLI